MSCKCVKCGKYCDCGEEYCDKCFIEKCCEDDGIRKLGEKLSEAKSES